MKNIILNIILYFFLFPIVSGQGNYYQFINEISGNTLTPVPSELELASQQLNLSLPSNFRNSFRVYSSSFYLHRKNFDNGIPSDFQRTIDSVEIRSEYFLLIARELNPAGEIIRFWTELKLPTTDSLDCLANNDIALIQGKIDSKLSKYLGNKNSNFVTAEKVVIEYLKDEMDYIVHCCHINNSNGNCPLNILSDEDILIDLYERGYEGIPITITNVIGINENTSGSRVSCNIADYSEIEFNIGNITNCNINNNICSFIQSLPNNLTNKIYITDNTTYKDYINIIVSDFINNEYDIGAHFHIYDSNDDYIPDLILYFDYSTIDIAWCPYLEEYDPENKFYSKFQFTGSNPITLTNNQEGKVGFWRKVLGNGQNDFIVQANKHLGDNNIPEQNLYFFDISEDLSLLSEAIQIYLELNLDLVQFPHQAVRFAVIYEPKLQSGNYNELLNIFREEEYSGGFRPSSNYYGWVENSSYFHCGNTIGAKWDLFWTSDNVPIPILDKEWAAEYLNCPPTVYLAGNLPTRALKPSVKKAAYKSGNIWKVYSYQVGKLFYYGITKREFEERLLEHVAKLKKNGETLINEERLYNNIDQQTAKGIEQLFISWHKDLVKDSRNIINSISPKKLLPNNTRAYKAAVDKAYNYLKNTPGIQLPPGYNLENMYDFAKSYYTNATNLPW